jgi:hypothetical protein
LALNGFALLTLVLKLMAPDTLPAAVAFICTVKLVEFPAVTLEAG